MRHIFKKVSSVFTAVLCAAAITAGSAGIAWAADEDALKEKIVQDAEGLTDTIIELPDEQIENYQKSSDAFTSGAITSWAAAKEELGEKSEEEAGETDISYANGEYTVTVPVAFENYDAEFVYVFEENGMPTSMTVDVVYPMSVTLKNAGLNTLMGLGTVFIMLIFLSFIISLFKYIPNGEKKKKEAAPAPAPVAAVPAVEEEAADDTELIAVIAAAIAASEGTTPDGFVVRSIRKINRKKR